VGDAVRADVLRHHVVDDGPILLVGLRAFGLSLLKRLAVGLVASACHELRLLGPV